MAFEPLPAQRRSRPFRLRRGSLDLEQAAARALLDGWIAAQNAADFAAYSALYAELFVGIKRVGDNRLSLRPAWLAG